MRYVVEWTNVISLSEGSMRAAYVYALDERWPTRASKPLITLVGKDDPEVVKALGAWVEQGYPSIDELKTADEPA